MKTKILIGAFVVCALALTVNLSVLPSAAQAPTPATSGPTNISPFTAIYPDFQSHQIPAGAYLWYMFDYAGDNTKINVLVPNGGLIGLEFRVYTPQQAMNIENEDKFVGRGNRDQVPCSDGKCTSPDLTWQGAFKSGGPYFILLINPNNVWVTYQLLITGESVWHGTPTPTPAVLPTTVSVLPPAAATPASPTGMTTTATVTAPVQPVQPVTPPQPPVVIPTPTPLKGVANDSPYTAVYVRDNREQNIPANTDMWYKFDYGGDRSLVTVILYNGNVSGIWFAIFTPDQAISFTDNKYIGRGMTQPILCDQGKCSSNDLVWVGAFSTPGTYFIRVTNPNDKPWPIKLHIEGLNINIIE